MFSFINGEIERQRSEWCFITMAFKDSKIFVINIIFGICVGNLWTLNVIRPVHRIPIRPLDRSTMRRLSLRPTEINPDSEPVFLPAHLANQRPLQIMERISVPMDANNNRMRQHKDNFNVLNFDAYVMKPTNGMAPNPVTERVFRLVNQTEYYRGDAKPSPSQHKYRSKSASKKSKKPMYGMHVKEFDDLEFYRAYLEHQKHAAMVKRLKQRPEPSSHLPIGIEYFEHRKKNQIAFPPITYSPHYLNNLHRSHHHEEVEASNVQQVQMRHPNIVYHEDSFNGLATTPMTPIPTTVVLPLENEVQPQTQTNPPSEVQSPYEQESYHNLASAPEMYRFTIDDVVFKQPPPGMVNYPFTGPVTLPPPLLKYQNVPNSHMMRTDLVMPMSANTVHENRFDYQTQLNYPSNPYINTRINYPQPVDHLPYQNVPIEGASSYQEIQKYPIRPISMTTEMAITTTTEKEINDTVAFTKPAYQMDAKRLEKRNKRRRLYSDRHRPDSRRFNHQNDMLNNLEFSSSYTKRRTQGYNSEEEPATTPISPAKLRSMKDETTSEDEVISTTPKTEQFKYFQ